MLKVFLFVQYTTKNSNLHIIMLLATDAQMKFDGNNQKK